MTTTISLLLAFNLLAVGYLVWKITVTNHSPVSDEHRQLLENLRKESQEGRERDREHLNKILSDSMQKTTKTMQTQFAQSSQIIQKITQEITAMKNTNTQVLDFTKDLKDLQAILKQPKGRGVLGEYWLESLLGHVLQPEQYSMQYKFKDAEVVDAVVFFQEKIIPVDAKFSLARYNDLAQTDDEAKRTQLEKEFKQDLKLRIDETAKYIRPEENTTDFAFMFLPAEGIFYDLLINQIGDLDVNRRSLNEYAFAKRVIIASPATFFAYLQTVLQGLKAFKMEESARSVQKNVAQLSRHLNAYESFMQKLGNNLGTSVSMYNQAYGEFKKIDKDVYRLTEGAVGGEVEAITLEKPSAQAAELVEVG